MYASAMSQREFRLNRRKSLSSRHGAAIEIIVLSGRCQLGMGIRCRGHGGTSQDFLEMIRLQFPE